MQTPLRSTHSDSMSQRIANFNKWALGRRAIKKRFEAPFKKR